MELLKVLVADREWDEARDVSKSIVEDIKLAIDFDHCKTGTPHLEGLYSIGTMTYMYAPRKVKRSLDKMNLIIKSAKENIPAKRRKKAG